MSDSTRLYGDSMEDPDPQATRKRPRLDSGSRVSDSLSVNSPLATPAALAVDMDVVPDSARPASKMTINVKSPTAEMIPEHADSQTSLGTDAQPHSKDTHAAAPANVISISSSPAQSPEIEVAELEDMDQDPNTSNWRPLEEALRDQGGHDVIEVQDMLSLADTFPKIRQFSRPRDSLSQFCQLVERCDLNNPTPIVPVKVWMDECVRNLDRLTPEAFVEESEFWEGLPTLVETLLRRQQGLLMEDGLRVWDGLEEFLADYAQITLHVIRLDIMIMQHLANEPDPKEADSLCQRYLYPFAWTVQYQSIPFYRAMESLADAEMPNLLLRLREKLTSPPIDAIAVLVEYASLIIELTPKIHHFASQLVYVLLVVNSFVDGSLERREQANGDATSDSSLIPPCLQPLYELVRLIDQKYQDWITKKSPWTSSELSDHILRQIPRAYNLFCLRDPEFVHQLSKDLSIELPGNTSLKESALVLSWAWKFGSLKKHLMDGRMELRVHGVETMQSDLVTLWKQNMSSDPGGLSLPFIRYLVHFIQTNKIVDYLVGVDSHPQLISRSSNIVGFLVVTSAYTDAETDTIWRTVTESQDGRIVSEVLAMLVRTFYMHQTASPALIYICKKALELPLDRFDPRIIDFCDNLLGRISDKPIGFNDHVDTIPLRLCVRLIRESTAAEDISVEHKKQLQSLGSKHLESFIKSGISDEDRTEMYEQCIQDLAEMNQFTPGSIQVLNALVPIHDTQEMWKLATDFDLTGLVIKDLLHIVNGNHVDFADPFSQHGLISRVAILFRLIEMAPDTITPELGNALWKDILLAKNLGVDGHKAVWSMMVNALSRSSKPNPFLERCINEYLPTLLPKDYSQELLSFAKQSVTYGVRFNPPAPAGANEVISIPGMDRIWSFILTAPPGSIETEATKFAIDVYLDHQIIRNSPRSAVNATHISIVNRCIEQLKSAAATLKRPESGVTSGDARMETNSSNDDMEPDELEFRRSLLFLRQFLYGLRTRPHYSPPQGSPPSLPERPLKGDPIDISWQSFNGNSCSKVNSLRIGDLSTAAELVERLTQLTGFSNFTAIRGGQRVKLLENPDVLLKDLKFPQGLLIIRKAPDAQEVAPDYNRPFLTPVDHEVLKHFDELYDLLALKDDLAHEMFDFLVAFPPQNRVVQLVKSEKCTEKDLFPIQKPFVAFYSFQTLLICLRDEVVEVRSYPENREHTLTTEKASPKQSFVSHNIAILVASLTGSELSGALTQDRIRIYFFHMILECLLLSLAAYHPEDDDSVLIEDANPVVRRLLEITETSRFDSTTLSTTPRFYKVICGAFAVLMEGSMRDYKFWAAVKQEIQFDRLIRSLLLEESHQIIRNEILERVKMICAPSKFPKQAEDYKEGRQLTATAEYPARIDMLATIWSAIVQNIPKTSEYAAQSAEFFKVTLWVFRSVAEISPRDVIFGRYLKDWSEVMFRRRTEEFVGREPVDEMILGFALLLELCLDLADSAGVELDTFDLAEQILTTYLFPDLSPETDDLLSPQVPVMHSMTRQKLYSIINLLCKRNDANLFQTMEILDDLVPREYTYGPNWSHDRSKMIRAPEGYAGLKNLSNTCYLNSLMTQLFMNVEFRDFMLKLRIVDPDSSQKLLDETQKLFAWMQNTWTKSVDPQHFVESIRTYDNEAIDVTIQMDVDEFYNLLFDRWEAQVVDPEDKKRFRLFYGGQLVQQIKSKECSHISERLEPFSAIQCDIKGKASLEESLQAYVEGEIMQGDNKYSCTACGRHVDAVKRACLKDVPDNLIFHLKRFDFDMVTMTRSKINDEFQFPDRIDMTPYNVEYLSDPHAAVDSDIFELVGVLVHTGTAESGHYYSYVRERPSSGAEPSWVEFNDSDVSRFDPSTIADQCFGASGDYRHTMAGVKVSKVWNAYMLFYQRVSMMDRSKEAYKPMKPDRPVHVAVPAPLANFITMENEVFIRTYCLLDPSYADFVQGLLERVKDVSSESPHSSQLQTMFIDVGMETLEQLCARTKDHTGLGGIFGAIYLSTTTNPQLALQTLKWLCNRQTSVRNLLLRTTAQEIRQKMIYLVVGSVKKIQTVLNDPNLDKNERHLWQYRYEPTLDRIVDMLEDLWPSLQSAPRAWEDYFDFLVRLAETDVDVVGVLLENEMFIKCLEIIWLDPEDRKNLRGLYPNYCRLLDKGREFNYKKMMDLCEIFFKNVDLTLAPVPDNKARPLSSSGKYPLSVTESNFIWPLEEEGGITVLMKILQHEKFGRHPASRKIFACFVDAEPQAGALKDIIKTLQIGLRFSPAEVSIPFLQASFKFCTQCHEESSIADMIRYVAKGVESINNSAGLDHLSFFTELCTAENERLKLRSDWFTAMVQETIPDFAPTLLIDTEKIVRQGTLEVLKKLILVDDSEDISEEMRSRCVDICRNLTQSCIDRIQRSFFNGQVQNVESRLVYPITSVVTHCLENYFDESEEDQQTVQEANGALLFLEQITVDVPNDLVSESDIASQDEWEATSALASDSDMGLAGSP
ncbi:uncharacterized protein N7459_002003 [Penicillium hispanicum]|uniref:uncharacterized protein n=1 Tax=Penicillium hispanicum TaxID=1080232 RepID=UPI0025408E82|nr:uncharacterized protein N7459_002003 [Penicillium hispanicum]KAJ5591634.1 hypothetical protein N7459_002003 [Penicillium hispanicum]